MWLRKYLYKRTEIQEAALLYIVFLLKGHDKLPKVGWCLFENYFQLFMNIKFRVINDQSEIHLISVLYISPKVILRIFSKAKMCDSFIITPKVPTKKETWDDFIVKALT